MKSKTLLQSGIYITEILHTQWFTLLLRIPKVQVSNLGLETDYPDWDFRGFTQSLKNSWILP